MYSCVEPCRGRAWAENDPWASRELVEALENLLGEGAAGCGCGMTGALGRCSREPEGNRAAGDHLFVNAIPERKEKAVLVADGAGCAELRVECGYAVAGDAGLAETEIGIALIPELDDPGAPETKHFGEDVFLEGGCEDGDVERCAAVEDLAVELTVHFDGPGTGGGIVLGGRVGPGLDDAEGERRGLGKKRRRREEGERE